MWRRTYLGLVLLRLFFAVSPSYLHPDEHFQGPEVIAGQIFHAPSKLTWEFSSTSPIRSLFPLWLVYGWPLTILKWISDGIGYHDVSPQVVYYSLRLVMFALSFVMEDWALHELLPTPRQRRVGIILVASSYVTWTWQSHTFSNSLETLVVLWSLVVIQRIQEDTKSSQLIYSALLGFLVVLGTFNRITFPAFIVIPILRLLPHFRIKPWCFVILVISGLANLLFAIALDTEWYTAGQVTYSDFFSKAIVTPVNNILYNIDTSNLAKHGLHPFYQHFVVNLPQLLGPATLLLVFTPRSSILLYSALFATAVLSCFAHQEARFLIPAIPLILSSIRIPSRFRKTFFTVWMVFNLALGVLMGIFHQGGIVPAQLWIGQQSGVTDAFWWKTLSPPTYLLGRSGAHVQIHDLMGRPGKNMTAYLTEHISCASPASSSLLVAPLSATFLDTYVDKRYMDRETLPFTLTEVWRYSNHLNLDDMDFGDVGVLPTLQRIVGRRGLGVWRVNRQC